MRLRYSIKVCRPTCILEREREHIGSIWSRSLALLSYYLLLKVLHIELLEILEVFSA
jgi:hypothetical protein